MTSSGSRMKPPRVPLHSALSSTISTLNGKKQDSVTSKAARDTAKRTLRRCLSGLAGELGQRLSEDDGRWRRSGLNLPSAPNEFFIMCAPSVYAPHYRFFTQRPGVDAEPIHVGNADEPMLDLTALTTGATFDVYVSAANSGAENRLSKVVQAVVAGEEEAAA